MTVQLDELVTRDDVPVMIDYGTSRRRASRSATSTVTPATVVGVGAGVGRRPGRRRPRHRPVIQASGISVDQDVAAHRRSTASATRSARSTSSRGPPASRSRSSRPPVADGPGQAGHHRDARRRVRGRRRSRSPADVVTVEGDAEQLARAGAGRHGAGLGHRGVERHRPRPSASPCPSGIVPLGDDEVDGHRHAPPGDRDPDVRGGRPSSSATRSGPRLRDRVDRVLVTIGGSVADLDRLEGVDPRRRPRRRAASSRARRTSRSPSTCPPA